MNTINNYMNVNASNNFLYVNCLNSATISLPAIKLEVFMEKFMKKYFNVISIYDINETNIIGYDLVIISATCFSSTITKMSHHFLFSKYAILKKIKNIVVLLHDLHDYSFTFAYNKKIIRKNINPNIYGKFIPVLSMTRSKKILEKFFENHNIKSLISIYDCPEYNYFFDNFRTIKNFFQINHGYPNHIFAPISCSKKYDVLFYGDNNQYIYPLRCRLASLLKNNNIRSRFVNTKEYIQEYQLATLINESWICIACVSNYSYFVRKYLEISACNSIVVGDINSQGYNIIGSNMIFIDKTMTNQDILDKVNFYLINKEIIAGLSFNKLNYIQQENYESYAEKLNIISNSIINNQNCQYNFTKKYSNVEYHKIIHNKILMDISFDNNSKKITSNNYLDKGLYLLKIVSSNIDNFCVIDDNNKKLTRRETYIFDDLDKDTYYISFVLDDKSKISIPMDYINNEYELYNICVSNNSQIHK
ncbi:hypothetical protein QJ857_gp0882 [Tupanvirus soda lake]|uniref:Uncharacterized protein n=2 Tax=Tupanvirus TaxID=2094720 RepID=A0A6N1NKC0_9VIRU|nr:hypothetical protein QJ857_gp0882 [Tupanvirus soda lake]QKU35169.1 hypothetical protein [Tupanvirus soda lake]